MIGRYFKRWIYIKFYLLEYPLPKRPDFGKSGRAIKLKANFFSMTVPDTDIHHYDVTINDGKFDDKTPKELNRQIIEELVKLYKKVFNKRPVFDGKKNMYAKDALPFNGVVSIDLRFNFLFHCYTLDEDIYIHT